MQSSLITVPFIAQRMPVFKRFTVALLLIGGVHAAHADSMSALIAEKTAQNQLPVPAATVSTRTTIQRARTAYPATDQRNYQRKYQQYQAPTTSAPASYSTYRYPEPVRQAPAVLPAFLGGNYDNVDSEYLPLLSAAETQGSTAAREVISTARTMALNERTIIQGGCWDYLDAVFKRAGVSRDTLHKGTYGQGPYASSHEIQAGDWLYYINHGYNGVEHSGLFVGWVDEAAHQALMLSYAGENRREPARYRVYDLSNVYQIMRPSM